MPHVSVLIVSYGHGRMLSRAVRPVLDARSCTVDVVVLNNDPADDVAAALPEELRERVRVVELGANVGFCRAHNRGLAETRGEFVFLVNPDLFVEPDHVDVLVDFFAQRPRAGCASGKILREGSADTIDSAGLAIGRNRRAVDRGEGLPDDGARYVREEEVFAASGAAFFARRSALEDVAADGEVFDESFFMYKEDLDLSWRLRLRGWECWYVPAARARHVRGSRGLGAKSYRSGLVAFHRSQLAKPPASRIHSMRNQWSLLVKNEDRSSFVRDAPQILARELVVLGWTALFAPRTLVAIPQFASRLPKTLAKRRAAQARRTVPPDTIRPWFGRG